MSHTIAALAVANRCTDAYSYDRYADWPAVAEHLLSRGLTEDQTERMMRSKHMRWAGDRTGKDSGVQVSDLKAYLDDPRSGDWRAFAEEKED